MQAIYIYIYAQLHHRRKAILTMPLEKVELVLNRNRVRKVTEKMEEGVKKRGLQSRTTMNSVYENELMNYLF